MAEYLCQHSVALQLKHTDMHAHTGLIDPSFWENLPSIKLKEKFFSKSPAKSNTK